MTFIHHLYTLHVAAFILRPRPRLASWMLNAWNQKCRVDCHACDNCSETTAAIDCRYELVTRCSDRLLQTLWCWHAHLASRLPFSSAGNWSPLLSSADVVVIDHLDSGGHFLPGFTACFSHQLRLEPPGGRIHDNHSRWILQRSESAFKQLQRARVGHLWSPSSSAEEETACKSSMRMGDDFRGRRWGEE